jgi:Holliday junction resolvase
MFNGWIVEELLMTVKLREAAIELELVRRVRERGGACEKVTVLGRRGFFDRLVVLPGGRVIFVECKRPKGGRLSAHQILRVHHYRQLGAEVAVVAYSADIDRLLSS